MPRLTVDGPLDYSESPESPSSSPSSSPDSSAAIPNSLLWSIWRDAGRGDCVETGASLCSPRTPRTITISAGVRFILVILQWSCRRHLWRGQGTCWRWRWTPLTSVPVHHDAPGITASDRTTQRPCLRRSGREIKMGVMHGEPKTRTVRRTVELVPYPLSARCGLRPKHLCSATPPRQMLNRGGEPIGEPHPRAVSSAASVQLSGVPLPTTPAARAGTGRRTARASSTAKKRTGTRGKLPKESGDAWLLLL